jgi:polar amino acid transport system substrate-binding protein
MRFLVFLAVIWLGLVCGARAESPVMTISTNTTLKDRKVLTMLSTEAFRRAGLTFNLDSHPSARSLDLANQGVVDGEGLRVAGLEQQYPNLIPVPERFAGISFVAFSRNTSIKLDQGWSSLKPHRIAFINGWKLFEANATEARSVTKVDKVEQLFQMLDADRVDVVLYTLADGLDVMKRLGISNVVALTPSLRDTDMYLYLNKKHALLVPRIAQALRDMKADGSYAKLMAQATSQ